MKALKATTFASLLLATLLGVATAEATPLSFSYGGRLSDGDAAVQGPVDLELRFFRAASGGSAIADNGTAIVAAFNGVSLDDGVFQVEVAAPSNLTAAQLHKLFDGDEPVYIEVKDKTSGKLYPRQRLVSMPYALKVPADGKRARFGADGKLTVGPSGNAGANEFLTTDADGNLMWASPAAGSASSLQGKAIDATAPTAAGQVLKYDGSKWVAGNIAAGGGSVTSVTASAPLSVTNGTSTPTLSISQASTSTSGYLSSADWNAFNGKQASLGFTPLNKAGDTMAGALNMNSHVISNLAAPTATGDAATKDYVDSATGGALKSDGSVALSGDWSVGGHDITGVGNLALDTQRTLGLGAYDNSQETTLIGTLTAGDKGKTWFNSYTNEIKFWNGSSASSLGVSGAGLTNLNGQTGNTQTLSLGTAGTAPAWSSASDDHKLNLPLASATGVTAGLLSKADYDSFAAKQNALGAASGDLTGTYPALTIVAGAVDTTKLAAGAVATANIAAGAVTGTEIAADSVTSAKIAADSIVASDIAADAITASELADNAVDTAAIAAGAVTGAKIAGGAIDTTKLAAGAVTGNELGADAVTSAKISDGTITNADVSASAAIADSKLATISSAGKVSGAAITSGTIGGSTALDTTGGVAASGNITVKGTGAAATELRFNNGANANYVALKAGSLSGNTTWILPTADGSSGQVLTTNGTGQLGWASGAAPSGAAGGVLTGSYPNPDIAAASVTSIMIQNNTILDADISGSAAIQDTKLATISTPGKVSGTAITGPVALGVGSASSPSYTISGDTDTGLWSPGANVLAVSTNASERLRIDASGNVGIGTTAPAEILEVQRANNGPVEMRLDNPSGGTSAMTQLGFRSNGTLNAYISVSNSGAMSTPGGADSMAVWNRNSGPLIFATNDMEKVRITPNGFVGIGTTTPSRTLDVNGLVHLAPMTPPAPGSSQSGDLVVDSADMGLKIYNGSNWVPAGGVKNVSAKFTCSGTCSSSQPIGNVGGVSGSGGAYTVNVGGFQNMPNCVCSGTGNGYCTANATSSSSVSVTTFTYNSASAAGIAGFVLMCQGI